MAPSSALVFVGTMPAFGFGSVGEEKTPFGN